MVLIASDHQCLMLFLLMGNSVALSDDIANSDAVPEKNSAKRGFWQLISFRRHIEKSKSTSVSADETTWCGKVVRKWILRQ